MKKSNRYFCIGDIHGEFDKLLSLMDILVTEANFSLENGDTLVALGDYVDRGKQSYNVIEYLRQLKEKHPDNVIVLRGNHEDMLLDLAKGISDLALYNGGNQTVDSYGQASKLYGKNNLYKSLIKVQHFDFLNNLPYFYENEDYFFNHSPILKEQYRGGIIGLDFRQDKHELTWGYADVLDMWDTKLIPKEPSLYSNEHYKTQVVGHIHHLKYDKEKKIYTTINPMKIDNLFFVDTGCGCAKEAVLTCVMFPEQKFFQSDGKKGML